MLVNLNKKELRILEYSMISSHYSEDIKEEDKLLQKIQELIRNSESKVVENVN